MGVTVINLTFKPFQTTSYAFYVMYDGHVITTVYRNPNGTYSSARSAEQHKSRQNAAVVSLIEDVQWVETKIAELEAEVARLRDLTSAPSEV